jgi:poly-gamma-glutamate capsule biosynthesis protein CapA/YwtB (metallophosphatase superfamily)
MNTGGLLNKRILFTFLVLLMSVLLSTAVYATESLMSITAVGDIMMGTTFPEPVLPPHDGAGIFDAVKSDFGASDIVFGNLEGPLIDNGKTSKCRKNSTMCFAFSTPTRYAKYLKEAGFTILNLANNHSLDFGDDGMTSTVVALDALSIRSVAGGKIANLDVKGKKVALVGFSFSSTPPYSINDVDAARNIVGDLKASNDIVIVSFHGGAEGKAALKMPDAVEYFAGEKRGNCIEFSRTMVDAGADLVLGHGPHVLRPMELYKNKLIVYSLGNFLTYGRFNIAEENGISMILKADISLDTGNFANGKIIPVRLANKGIPQPDIDGNAINLIRELSAKDIGGVDLIITAEGGLEKSPPPAHALSSASLKVKGI